MVNRAYSQCMNIFYNFLTYTRQGARLAVLALGCLSLMLLTFTAHAASLPAAGGSPTIATPRAPVVKPVVAPRVSGATPFPEGGLSVPVSAPTQTAPSQTAQTMQPTATAQTTQPTATVQTTQPTAAVPTSPSVSPQPQLAAAAQITQPTSAVQTSPSTSAQPQPVTTVQTIAPVADPAPLAVAEQAKPATGKNAKAKSKGKTASKKTAESPVAPKSPQPQAEQISGPQAEAAAAYAAGDYAKAHTLWQSLAEKADARAMYNLGVLYDKGQGVTEDPSLAAFWFLKSAEAGHAAGMSNLGRLLEQGRGLTRDLAQAAQWFRKAADKGLAEAQYNLAVLYERGLGLEKSDREAAAWYSRAAAQNQTEAQGRLGQMYREGRGVNKNATRAVLLLYGASMDGNSEAIRALEEMAVDPAFKSKAAPSRLSPAVLFGLPLEHATRDAVRQAMAASKVPAVREDAAFICDVYDVRSAIPGATEMAACYGPGAPQPLGFVKIDYPSPDKQQTEKVTAMLTSMLVDRFGPPAATEGQGAALWNLGTVIVAVQHSPATKETGLMYMVPRVYHLTRYK